MNDEERLERVSSKLANSPQLHQAIKDAAASGELPTVITNTLPSSTLKELQDGADPLESPIDLGALEAIVQRFGRPPLLVSNDTVVLQNLEDFPAGTDTKIKNVEPVVKSVGRVEFFNHQMAWGGTGWVIKEEGDVRIVATNRHVAKVVAQRTANGRGVFLRSPQTGVRYGMALNFKAEAGTFDSVDRPIAITDIDYIAENTAPDIALIRITGKNLPNALPLSDTEAKAQDLVALIGYPAHDTRNNLADQARYFADLYEVKRFAPGRVIQAISGNTLLTHDCTSLGGNSGSPLIRLDDGKVVGLHFAGTYGVANSAVSVTALRDLLTKGPGGVSAGARIAAELSQQETVKDGTHQPADLADRRGYDPTFLGDGAPAPVPGIPETLKTGIAIPTDEDPTQPGELRYTHFGVYHSTDRRIPILTAVNIDGAHTVHVKRGTDRWFKDGRIPADAQLNQKDYDDPLIDRGHMVRRQDPDWDPAATSQDQVTELARQADSDTFHYTNAAPQHSTLNQGKQLWQGLENYILDSARTQGLKACVFTGPVVRDDDPALPNGVKVPVEFWKIVAMVNADTQKLHATGYLLSQGDLIRELLETRQRTEAMEGFVLGPYRTFQIAISDLADATGYDFTTYAQADPLTNSTLGTEAINSGEPIFLAIDDLADITT
jgi:endonuclease G